MDLKALMNVRHELGRMAEDRAAEYVRSLGWTILERNMRTRYGELDIIAIDPAPVTLMPSTPLLKLNTLLLDDVSRETVMSKGELVVIEVRCRTVGRVQSPIDSVGPQKLKHLIQAGEFFVDKIGWKGFWRVDLIGFTVPLKRSETWRLEHVRDITDINY